MVSIRTLMDHARMHLQGGQPYAAREYCRQVLAQEAGHPDAVALFGTASLVLDDMAAAERAFRLAMTLRPDFVQSYIDLSAATHELGDHAAAYRLLNRANRIVPGDKVVESTLCTLFTRANTLLKVTEPSVQASGPAPGPASGPGTAAPRFNICLGTYPQQNLNPIGDLAVFIRAALQECGCIVTMTVGELLPDACNLFIDNVYLTVQIERLERAQVPYGLILTEKLGPDGRWGEGRESEDGAFETFRSVARRASFVWALLEESVGPCRRLVHPNTHYFPFGWLDSLQPRRLRTPAEIRFDFAITGQVTSRRIAVVEALRARGRSVVFPGPFAAEYLRDACLDGVRANLSIQKTDDHAIVSVARICQSLIRGVPVVLEHPLPDPGEVAAFCFVAPPREFVDVCVGLAADFPDAAALEMRQRFRERMPMRESTRRVLESCGFPVPSLPPAANTIEPRRGQVSAASRT